MIDPPPPSPAPVSRRRRVLRRGVAVLAVAFGAFVIAAPFIHVEYVIISPGRATPLDDRVVAVSGAPTYEHSGELLFLTVRVTDNDPNLYQHFFAKLDGDVKVVKKADVLGCTSYSADERLNRLLMEESQSTATAVALRHLGYPVTDVDHRVVIANVACDGPSRGLLEPGDIITAVDATPVTTAEEVRPLVRAHRPEETLTLTVMRGKRSRDVTVRLGSLEGEALLGIQTQTITRVSSPVDVDIDTRRVNGPSAGLAFTLAIIDELTSGDLTGGKQVAVTGTINSDGTVGKVGGVEQKAVTARDQGATLMLVPRGEARLAKEQVDGDLRVVAVRTLDDALAALRHAGGDAVTVPPAPGQ